MISKGIEIEVNKFAWSIKYNFEAPLTAQFDV